MSFKCVLLRREGNDSEQTRFILVKHFCTSYTSCLGGGKEWSAKVANAVF